jgi:hypothetical protein
MAVAAILEQEEGSLAKESKSISRDGKNKRRKNKK